MNRSIENLTKSEVLKMATDESTSTEELTYLLRRYGESAVVSNSNFDQKLLRNWATSINEEYRCQAAKNPALPRDLMKLLEKDICEKVSKELEKNPTFVHEN